MFNPRTHENTRPDGIGVLEIVPDPDALEEPPRFVPLKRTALGGAITGPLAALRLTQVFGYGRSQCDRVLEAVYRFPLPGDAAVTGVRVQFGAVEIRAELKERQQAETDYAEAKRHGRQAALLTRESPDVFTLQVAGLTPDQDVTVETDYVQLARAEGAGWSLRIPLTTSPRYVRSDELTARHAQGQPLCLLRDPGHRFALDVTLTGGGEVESSTHHLTVTPEDDRLRLRLAEGEVIPDRDCVLSWRPPQDADQPRLQVLLHDDPASAQVYFLALVAPPRARPAGTGPARETVLLVDHSGSMQGPKWEAADWAVKKFLSEQTERDAFALGLFHSTTHWLGKGMQPASATAVQKAIAFLERNRDSGGTELGVALEQALDRSRMKGDASRHVLIITDAEVTDAGRILRLADEEARRPNRRRIDVLCIDAAPNSFLAHELAERGGGVSRFLTSDPEELDIATALDEVLADWAQPVLTGLRLEVNRPNVQAAGRQVQPAGMAGSTLDLGDLPAGRSIWVAGRFAREEAGELTFRALALGGREVAVCRPARAQPDRRPALKALFGARRVLGLEYLIHAAYAVEALREQLERLGYDPHAIFPEPGGKKAKVYAENIRADATAALKKLLVREALDYGLACAETAFVAVRTEAGQPVAGTVAVANALPAGWSPRFGGDSSAVAAGKLWPRLAAPASPMDTDSVFSCLTEFTDTAAEFEDEGEELEEDGEDGDISSRSLASSPTPAIAAPSGSVVLFNGIPHFKDGEAVLFDSAHDSSLANAGTFTQLRLEFPGSAPAVAGLDAGLALLLYVDDLAAPRARVRLADLLKQGGERPLNLRREPGQHVRLTLTDAAGAWTSGAPGLVVTVRFG